MHKDPDCLDFTLLLHSNLSVVLTMYVLGILNTCYIAFVLLDIFSKIFIDFCVRALKHCGWLTRHYFASFVLFANIKVGTNSCIYIQHILQRQKLFVQPSTLLKCVVNTLLLIKSFRPVSIQAQLNPSRWSTRHKNLSVQ